MRKLQTIILFLAVISMFAFSTKADAQISAKTKKTFTINGGRWNKVLKKGETVTIFSYKQDGDTHSFGIYYDDYAGIIDTKNIPFDVEFKQLKKLPKNSKKKLSTYTKEACTNARIKAFSGKYNTTSPGVLNSDDYDISVSKNDLITIIGYKSEDTLFGLTFYYAIIKDDEAGYCDNSRFDNYVFNNVPLPFLPSTDDPQVETIIAKEKQAIKSRKEAETKAFYVRQQEEKRKELEAEAEKKRIQDSINVAKFREKQQKASLALAIMKQLYMHKTWYYRYYSGASEYRRFEPIEVTGIKIHCDSIEKRISFPMKLRYKNTNEVDSFDAVIYDDGNCSFEECFHNIPPQKEYPNVRHWKAVKNYQLVLGMNHEEVELVWGYPDDINTTKGRWGVHEQWVYYSKFGLHTRYLYFDNGRLTAIQR